MSKIYYEARYRGTDEIFAADENLRACWERGMRRAEMFSALPSDVTFHKVTVESIEIQVVILGDAA